jgi:hypothetical protein
MAFNRDYKLYGSGRFFDLRRDPGEKSALDITKLDGKAARNAKLLQAALDEFKGVRPAEIESTATKLRRIGGTE